jgi:glycosyltransferase involved in cell wall biosynthesis
MNIGIITIAGLFPQTSGSPAVIVEKALALSRLGNKVYIITDSADRYFEAVSGQIKSNPFPRWTYLLHRTIHRIIECWLARKGIPRDERFQFHSRYDAGMSLRVIYVALLKRIDVFHSEKLSYVYPALLSRALLGIPIVCVEHDVEYQRLNDTCDLAPEAVRFIKRLEQIACRKADAVVTVSTDDKKRLTDIGIDHDKISVIPHGLCLERYRHPDPGRVRKKYGLKGIVIVYHGTFTYKPNAEALAVITEKIIPLLQNKLEVTALIVGPDPPPSSPNPRIVFTNTVERSELADYLAAGDFAVVPISSGGGLRIKILEYFAAGVPVISTKKGAEGIPVENNRELLIADSPEEIAGCISRLIENSGQRREIVGNAFRFVQEYDWPNIAGRFVELYKKTIASA